MLTFEEEGHRYFWSGTPVPNVTRIIGHLTDYSRIPPDQLRRAQEEGTANHKLVELDCKNDLDVASIPEWQKGVYQAWCRFKDDTGFECWASEHRIFHSGYRYAGTLDITGLLRKLARVKGPVLIDVKRSLYAGPVIGLQTAAYLAAWNQDMKDSRIPEANRFALVLKKDGTYRLEQYSAREDFQVFLAQLITYRWRETHGSP